MTKVSSIKFSGVFRRVLVDQTGGEGAYAVTLITAVDNRESNPNYDPSVEMENGSYYQISFLTRKTLKFDFESDLVSALEAHLASN